MQKILLIIATLFLVSITLAQAETVPPAKVPGDQGIASINKNIEKNPDNKGLKNAAERLKKNKEKHKKQMAKHQDHREDKAERRETNDERHGNMSRHDRPRRPGK